MDILAIHTMALADWIRLILLNFGFVMFLIAIIFVIVHKLISGRAHSDAEIVYRWTALFALGLTGVYAFIMHTFFSDITAASIGWKNSPFEFELALADLALGVLGILSFKASYGFRLATVIAVLICWWGDAIGHFYQIIAVQNYSSGNAGTWLWMDIVVPLILLLSIIKLRPGEVMVV